MTAGDDAARRRYGPGARVLLVACGALSGVLVLAVLEGALWLAGAGEGPPAFDPFSGFHAGVPLFEAARRADGTRVFRLSPARLHDTASAHEIAPEREFLAEKPETGFRIFVVGGSSAAGFPYPPAHAFGAVLERRLQAALPGLEVEVVNAAVAGYSSRRVLVAVREIVSYAPDLLVVMSGHNEWAEQRYYSRLLDMHPLLFALRERLLGTRVFVWLSRLVVREADPEAALARFVQDEGQEFREMFAVRTRRARGSDFATPEQVAQRDALYRANLEEIARTAEGAGVPVVFLTLGQNLSDWPPGSSAHRADLGPAERARWETLVREGRARASAGDCAGALEAFGRALAIDDEVAELHFEVARCHRARGELEAARTHFRLASDLDRVPHGAPSWFNDIVREVARAHGALLVDVAAALEEESGPGLVGDDLFVEFAHPNLRAHQRIAAELGAALREAGVPRPAAQWREGGDTEPTPAALYAREPDLRVREVNAIRFACALAGRPACVAAQARRLRELDARGGEAAGAGGL
jgi:lysophospholipase L1-like esterase